MRSSAVARTAATVAAAAALGWLFDRLGLPVAWMVGPVAASAALTWAGYLQPVPPWLWRAAQAVIGASVVSHLSREMLARLAGAWGVALGSVVATWVLAALLGLLLPRLWRLDRATGLLGFVPGLAAGMVAASAELGADPAQVAVVQYVRLILVLLSAPLLVFVAHRWEPAPPAPEALADAAAGAAGPAGGFYLPGAAASPGAGGLHPPGATESPAAGGFHLPGAAGNPAVSEFPLPGAAEIPMEVALALVVIAAGVVLARRFPVPAGAVLFTMLLGGSAALFTGLHPAVPSALNLAALAVLGVFVGSRLDREALSAAWRLALVAGALSLGLMAGCVGIGWVLHVLGGFPLLTALLATAPGAMETMTAMAVATHAEPGLVLMVHVLRLLLTLLLAPLLTGLLARQQEATAGRLQPPGPGR